MLELDILFYISNLLSEAPYIPKLTFFFEGHLENYQIINSPLKHSPGETKFLISLLKTKFKLTF